ncbi:MAG: hypothetical protein ACIAXF_05080 [Phycisphaerales bacterium JB063]
MQRCVCLFLGMIVLAGCRASSPAAPLSPAPAPIPEARAEPDAASPELGSRSEDPSEVSPLERWRAVDDAAAASREGSTSLQLRYSSSWVSGPADEPVHEVYNEVQYTEQGDRYRMQLVSPQIRHRQVGPLEPHDWMVAEIDQAYDGRWLWCQRNEGGILFRSAKRDTWPMPTPLLWDWLVEHNRIGLESAIARGRLRVASVEEVEDADGKPLVEAVFYYVEADRLALRLWYDPALGHTPVRAEGFHDDNGEPALVMRDVIVHRIETEDAVYYLPTAGVSERFRPDGVRYSYREIEVDVDSIVINEDIPVETFTLDPGDNGQVYDSDQSRFLD